MTLEELKNKKVTLTLNKTFVLGEDLSTSILKEKLEDKEKEGFSDETLLNELIEDFYSSWGDFSDILDSDEIKVTIHD